METISGNRPPKSQNETLYNSDAGACNAHCSDRGTTIEPVEQSMDTKIQADYQLKSTSTVSLRSSSLSLLPSLITLPPGWCLLAVRIRNGWIRKDDFR